MQLAHFDTSTTSLTESHHIHRRVLPSRAPRAVCEGLRAIDVLHARGDLLGLHPGPATRRNWHWKKTTNEELKKPARKGTGGPHISPSTHSKQHWPTGVAFLGKPKLLKSYQGWTKPCDNWFCPFTAPLGRFVLRHEILHTYMSPGDKYLTPKNTAPHCTVQLQATLDKGPGVPIGQKKKQQKVTKPRSQKDKQSQQKKNWGWQISSLAKSASPFLVFLLGKPTKGL